MSNQRTLTWRAIPLVAALAMIISTAACDGGPIASNDAADTTESAPAGVAATQPPGDDSRGPGKVALIVAVAKYLPNNGWKNLNSDRDLKIMRAALERHGFAVAELTDSKATRQGIEASFRRDLIGRASPGDVALFHYSGHGQRITDADRIDEPDGYDESLVPYDAPASAPDTYTGAKHLRDDTLQDLLKELRQKVGPEGDVIVSLDSCFSGTATRGTGTARGSTEAIGKPRVWDGEVSADLGFVDGGSGTRGAGDAPAESGLAPLVALSAARNDELAWEADDAERNPVGSLSLALSTTLASADSELSYRGLHAKVKTLMAGYNVSNTPQVEGTDLNRTLFGGHAVGQAPYFEVGRAKPGGNVLQLKAGQVQGIVPGSRVEVYLVGTVQPVEDEAREACEQGAGGPECPKAAGVVEKAQMLTADIKLDNAVTPEDFNCATPSCASAGRGADQWWAFVTQRAFGTLDIAARIEGVGEPWVAVVTQALKSDPSKLVRIVDRDADVVVRQFDGKVRAETELAGFPLLDEPLEPDDPELGPAVRDRLKSYARNQYIRRLEFEPSPKLAVTLEMKACTLVCTEESNDQGPGCNCSQPLASSKEGSLELAEGDGFELEVTNSGAEDAYVAIVDLMPNGDVYVLWPEEGEQPTVVPKGTTFKIPNIWEVYPPFGTDFVKVFASKTPIEFRWLFGSPRAGSRGAPNALEQLFADTLTMGSRGPKQRKPVPKDSGVATFDLTYDIVPKE